MSSEGPDKTAGIPLVATSPRTVFETRHMNEKVMVTLPWGKITHPMTAYSVMRLVDNRRHSVCLNYGDAFVVHSRNTCADLFLKSMCDWQLSIDDDMIVPFGSSAWYNANTGFNLKEPFASFNALERLLAAEKTLVGALYFGRHKHGAPMTGEGANNPAEAAFLRKGPHDIVKPTRWVATGCLLTHRTVFEDIEKRYPNLARQGGRGGNWYSSSEHNVVRDLEQIQALLSKGPMDGEKCLAAYTKVEQSLVRARTNSSLGQGEDVCLCTRANECGHVPHVDLGLICGHVGHCVYGPYNTFQKTPNTP